MLDQVKAETERIEAQVTTFMAMTPLGHWRIATQRPERLMISSLPNSSLEVTGFGGVDVSLPHVECDALILGEHPLSAVNANVAAYVCACQKHLAKDWLRWLTWAGFGGNLDGKKYCRVQYIHSG